MLLLQVGEAAHAASPGERLLLWRPHARERRRHPAEHPGKAAAARELRCLPLLRQLLQLLCARQLRTRQLRAWQLCAW